MNYEDEIYSTKDFYLASWLKAKGIKLLKTIPQGNILFFQFEKVSDMEDLVDGYYSEEDLISAVKYKNAIRDLKALIHNMKIRNEMKY